MHIYSKAYQSYKMVPPEFEENGVKEVEYIHELWRLLFMRRMKIWLQSGK